MRLKYEKTVKNNIITLTLETFDFDKKENTALDQFGEPEISFEKQYLGKYNVAFTKKLRSNFRVKVKFNGTDDIETAAEAANLFLEELEELLQETISEYVDKLSDIDFETGSGYIQIKY